LSKTLVQAQLRTFKQSSRRGHSTQQNTSGSASRSQSPGSPLIPDRKVHEHLSQQEAKDEQSIRSVFAHESTFELVKKLFIYRMMGSNLFINHSLMGIQLSYRLFGKRITNWAIESTAASVFTGGVSVGDLKRGTAVLEQRGIGSIACYVVEGVRQAKNETLDEFLNFSLDSIKAITEGREDGHFALKLTAYISTDLMEKISLAQHKFIHEVLKVNYNDASDNSELSAEQLEVNLASAGITNYSR